MFKRFANRPRNAVDAAMQSFVPGTPPLEEVRQLVADPAQLLDRDAIMLELKAGDYVRQWSTMLGGKAIYVFHVVHSWDR